MLGWGPDSRTAKRQKDGMLFRVVELMCWFLSVGKKGERIQTGCTAAVGDTDACSPPVIGGEVKR
jgi:hypothetical protein